MMRRNDNKNVQFFRLANTSRGENHRVGFSISSSELRSRTFADSVKRSLPRRFNANGTQYNSASTKTIHLSTGVSKAPLLLADRNPRQADDALQESVFHHPHSHTFPARSLLNVRHRKSTSLHPPRPLLSLIHRHGGLDIPNAPTQTRIDRFSPMVRTLSQLLRRQIEPRRGRVSILSEQFETTRSLFPLSSLESHDLSDNCTPMDPAV